MTQFDPLRAAREELAGLQDVLTAIRQRENAAEIAMGQAESELNAVRKIRGYCEMEVGRQRSKIALLEAEAK